MTAVLRHEDPVIEELAVDGQTLDTTPEHPFYTEEEDWAPAGDLMRGEHIYRAGGGWGEVDGVAQQQRPAVMYNLTVQTAHTFFVGNEQLLVHNTCGQPPNPFGTCITAADMAQLASYIVSHHPGGFGNWKAGPATVDDIGRERVGQGYRISSDGRAWVSADGSRVYRPPQIKSTRGGKVQANLTYKSAAGDVNAHIDIDSGCS